MQGLQLGRLLAVFIGLWSLSAGAQPVNPQLVDIAQRTVHPVTLLSARGLELDEFEFHVPQARFIKLHFSQFKLPAGVTIEVSNFDGSESYRYSKNERSPFTFSSTMGDDGISSFSAMSISGDTAIIRILGDHSRINALMHRVTVDHFLQGSPFLPKPQEPLYGIDSDTDTAVSTIKSTCGSDERLEAACWADSHPGEFDRTRPVAMVLSPRGTICTAWRVGPENRLFTAEHCIQSQDDLTGAEVWFNHQATACDGAELEAEIKVTGNTLLASDPTLDFSLFTVNDFSSIESFGYLGLEVREGILGEPIYIPQHGLGDPKQLALQSDMNVSGRCEIDAVDHHGYAIESDLGYYCDTNHSSSGSPVIAGASGRVIALHHLGGCFNSGTKMSRIWPVVSAHFNDSVPAGDQEPARENLSPLAGFSFACRGLNCSFNASSSTDSDGEITDYNWNLGDGVTSVGVTLNNVYPSAGDYTVTLIVRDNDGATDIRSQTLSLVTENTPPVAKFTAICRENSCTFDAGTSYDPDGRILRYSWAFGDGMNAVGLTAAHEYAQLGEYEIVLTVEDDGSEIGTHRLALTLGFDLVTATEPVSRSSGDSAPDFAGPQESKIELIASVDIVRGQRVTSLLWSGARSFTVEVYRNDMKLATTVNDGHYRDLRARRQSEMTGRNRYKVCEVRSNVCSNEIEARF